MQPPHSNAGHGRHVMPGMQHLLRPEESTAISSLNMMANESLNSFAPLNTGAASVSVGSLSQPITSSPFVPPDVIGRPESFAQSSSAGYSTRPHTSTSIEPPDAIGRPESFAQSPSAGPSTRPHTSSSVVPPDVIGRPESFAQSSSAGYSTRAHTSSPFVPPDVIGRPESFAQSSSAGYSTRLHTSSSVAHLEPFAKSSSASPKPTVDQMGPSSLHTETQSVAANTMKISTKPTIASSKGDTKGLPRNKPGVASNKISPHNQYYSKGRTKAYSLFGKFSEVREEINARVEQQMREHNYDHTKRVALLNKERQVEFEKLSAEDQQYWIKRMEMENESARGLTDDFE
jgi:hypothetical protein